MGCERCGAVAIPESVPEECPECFIRRMWDLAVPLIGLSSENEEDVAFPNDAPIHEMLENVHQHRQLLDDIRELLSDLKGSD